MTRKNKKYEKKNAVEKARTKDMANSVGKKMTNSAALQEKAALEKLPKDVQQVMDDLRVEQSEWTGKYMDNHVKAAMDWAKAEQKVEVIELSAAEKAKWDAKLVALTEKWAGNAKSKGFAADAIVNDIKVLIEK